MNDRRTPMTDPVGALGKVLHESYCTRYPESDDADWRSDADYTIARLRASGFDVVPTAHPDDGHEHSWGCRLCSVDVVPTGDAGLDVARTEVERLQGYDSGTLAIDCVRRTEVLAILARLSSADTGGRG